MILRQAFVKFTENIKDPLLKMFAELDQMRHVRRVGTGDQHTGNGVNLRPLRHRIRRPFSSTDAVADHDMVDISVVFSDGQSAAVDMAVIVQCNAIVISTGSFGWWAAWLANRQTTIYYSMWPRPGSDMSYYFNASKYFPEKWIPMQ